MRTNLVTDNFKMLTGAGAGKVLISDANGNASWINPPNGVISPWLVEDENIVTDPDYKNVGIGTEQPKKKLDIHHTDTPGGISLTQMLQDNANGSELSFNKNSNEGIAPQCSMGHGYFEGRSSFFIWSCLDKKGEGKTEFYIDLNNGMTGIGTEWPDATLEVAGDMKVKDKLGIGCTPPSDEIYKVFVEGGIEARKIRVTAKDYPDFCFNEEYPLMPLRDLKKFISLNKHLPGVPTAREVEDNKGIEIGEMQTILLKKVEEQTLYILDLQKQIEELKAQVGSLTEK
ncbi:MAG TPA: hypothetical protein PKN44_15490 [Bacteroidales bacterium]|nr:hypothetical protein [Bacteroidales bacterium]